MSIFVFTVDGTDSCSELPEEIFLRDEASNNYKYGGLGTS